MCASRLGYERIDSFRDLIVWQKAMNLAEHCYQTSMRFPRDDRMVLGFEIGKSAVSVPSNIAEGFGRHYTAAYINHLWFANGSGNELQTQIELANRVKLVTEQEAAAILADAEEVGRMLRGLVKSLERPTR